MEPSGRSNFKRVKSEAIEEAMDLIQQPHVSAEIVKNVKDLLNIIEQLDKAEGELISGGADLRVLRKRYDALKFELKTVSTSLDRVKEIISSEITPILRDFLVQLTLVEKSVETIGEVTSKESTAKLRPLVKRLIEIFTKI